MHLVVCHHPSLLVIVRRDRLCVALWTIVLVIRCSWLRVTVVGRDRGRIVVVQRHGGCVVVVVVVVSGCGCIMTRGNLPV